MWSEEIIKVKYKYELMMQYTKDNTGMYYKKKHKKSLNTKCLNNK